MLQRIAGICSSRSLLIAAVVLAALSKLSVSADLGRALQR